eukprot:TRINITY_DN28444_c0_g1_i1.p1 TRINITY_DN28444_c0_g1~~TRINITY_DN28444_c0_g1_i1.p1  ORF type:complete len:392 (+),score=139.71 TRINITY_DN28444_c0_g1_i1:39-1214(+)
MAAYADGALHSVHRVMYAPTATSAEATAELLQRASRTPLGAAALESKSYEAAAASAEATRVTLESIRASYPSYTGPGVAPPPPPAAAPAPALTPAAALAASYTAGLRLHTGTPQQQMSHQVSPKRDFGAAAEAVSFSPPTLPLVPVVPVAEPAGVERGAAGAAGLDLTAWRLRLNQDTKEELKELVTSQYDRNSSGSIDFCDFLALWFSGQQFQVRRSTAPDQDGMGKGTEPLEVQAKHLYRIRELFNEYEEAYLGGIRYGLVAAFLKDLAYDADHDIRHYYGLSMEDLMALIDEAHNHGRARGAGAHGRGEARFDFAHLLQMLLKHVSDTEEVAQHYDEGCKVFQALRTKEHGNLSIFQNSTISTRLLLSVLGKRPALADSQTPQHITLQ